MKTWSVAVVSIQGSAAPGVAVNDSAVRYGADVLAAEIGDQIGQPVPIIEAPLDQVDFARWSFILLYTRDLQRPLESLVRDRRVARTILMNSGGNAMQLAHEHGLAGTFYNQYANWQRGSGLFFGRLDVAARIGAEPVGWPGEKYRLLRMPEQKLPGLIVAYLGGLADLLPE